MKSTGLVRITGVSEGYWGRNNGYLCTDQILRLNTVPHLPMPPKVQTNNLVSKVKVVVNDTLRLVTEV